MQVFKNMKAYMLHYPTQGEHFSPLIQCWAKESVCEQPI